MAIRVTVRHDRQIICPIRFARAVTGPPVIDAPEVDDRGFVMGNREGTWGRSTARGAMVGVTEGDTVRVRVLREDIDATAPLFATSTDAACASVVGGAAIPADGIFQVKGVKDFKNRAVAIQVRLGSDTGPVLGELEPHIFQLRTLRMRIHFVTINGTRTARDRAGVTTVFEEVNAIFRPCGIEFRLDEFVETAVNGFATAGQVTTNLNAVAPAVASWNEFSRLINTNFSRTKINLYCIVQNNGEWIGLTFDNDVRRPAAGVVPTFEGYGIAVEDAATPNTFAHELGHYLDLDVHSNANDAGAVVRRDMWVRRCLLGTPRTYTDVTLDVPPEPGHRNDIGYGVGLRGALLTVKNLAVDPRDDEVGRTRRRSQNPY